MSTEHTIHKNKNIELSVMESSSKLQLYCVTNFLTLDITDDMKPSELMKLFLKGIETCSYYMTPKEFNETMKTNFSNWSV